MTFIARCSKAYLTTVGWSSRGEKVNFQQCLLYGVRQGLREHLFDIFPSLRKNQHEDLLQASRTLEMLVLVNTVIQDTSAGPSTVSPAEHAVTPLRRSCKALNERNLGYTPLVSPSANIQ
jgi:hypothetical protein